jgi:hypothetical protein
MTPQVIRGSEKIEAVRGKVALRLGPLVYNIEKVDQDITKAIDLASPLSAEFRKDLLGGVPVIKGKFADGSPLLAIPNLVRMNRNPPAPPAPPVPAGQPRPAPPPPSSVVWINERA